MSGGSSLGTARRILLLPAAIIVSISLLFLICHLTQERSDELQCCLTVELMISISIQVANSLQTLQVLEACKPAQTLVANIIKLVHAPVLA